MFFKKIHIQINDLNQATFLKNWNKTKFYSLNFEIASLYHLFLLISKLFKLIYTIINSFINVYGRKPLW
jgi:hypothetical protein